MHAGKIQNTSRSLTSLVITRLCELKSSKWDATSFSPRVEEKHFSHDVVETIYAAGGWTPHKRLENTDSQQMFVSERCCAGVL